MYRKQAIKQGQSVKEGLKSQAKLLDCTYVASGSLYHHHPVNHNASVERRQKSLLGTELKLCTEKRDYVRLRRNR